MPAVIERRCHSWTAPFVVAQHLRSHRPVAEQYLSHAPRNASTQGVDVDAGTPTSAALTVVRTRFAVGLPSDYIGLFTSTETTLVPVKAGGHEGRPVYPLTP